MTNEQPSCPHRRVAEPWHDDDDGEIFFTCVDCGYHCVELDFREVIERPLVWTKAPPTQPGWYWFNGYPGNAASTYCGLVMTDVCGQGQIIGNPVWWNLHHFDGYWAGPITPPSGTRVKRET